MRYIGFIALLVMSTFASPVSPAEFLPGQVWSYKTRAGESDSTLTILKVENYSDLGRVVHIRVDGVRIKNALRGNTVIEVPHLPFKEAAVQASVTKLLRTLDKTPDFQD